MRKLKCILTAFVITIMTLCTPVYAASNKNYTVYDDYGNSFSVGEDDILVVIYDAEGNIVSSDIQPRQIYVNGTQVTIPAKGSAVTYQYMPSKNFTAGFYFVHSSYDGYATTPNRSITVRIRNSDSIGGTRYIVKSETFSTTESDNYNSPYYVSGVQAGCSSVAIYTNSISSVRPYYDARYLNDSSSEATVSVFVSMD